MYISGGIKTNKYDVPFSLWSVIAIVIVLSSITCNAEAASTEFNSTNWNLISGTMLEHGDGNLRAPPSVTTGLISYWNPGTDVGSGGTLTDIWGVNDGSISNGVWNDSIQMIDYNGFNSFVSCSDDESLNVEDLTVVTTVYPREITLNGIIAKYSTDNLPESSFNIMTQPDNLYFMLSDGSSNRHVSYDTTDVLPLDTSTHLAISFEQPYVMYYLNGEMEHNTSLDYPIQEGYLNLIFGAIYYSGSYRYFKGGIGETLIYNTILTNSQVNETRDNYHASTSYMEIDNSIDAGSNQIWKYFVISGTDVGSNTTGLLQINGSSDNISWSGWQDVNSTYDIGDTILIDEACQYRYATFRWYANTSYQPETDVIESVEIITFSSGEGGINDFTIDVISGQNTALLSTNTTFGVILPGNTINIPDTFNLTNTGNVDATVEATFTTFNGSVYGFNSTSGPIGGANFSLALTGQTLVSLNNIAAGTPTGSPNNVIADAVTDIWKVRLDIPSGQIAALYTGAVELTFSDVV